ncbi:MAG: hypothetical protein WAM60_15330 [Candidatus Promineifilaceae bacterium]
MTTQTVSLTTEQSQRRPHRFLQGMLIILACLVVVTILYLTLLWPWMSTWGATKAEQEMALPGDEACID